MSELVLEGNHEVKLPLGWTKSSLEDIIIYMIGGDWGKSVSLKIPTDYVQVNVIRSTELKNWETDQGKTAESRLIKESSLDKRRLQNGDILLEVSGGSSTFLVGRTVLVTNKILSNFKNPVVCSNFFRKISLHEEINPVYVSYYLLYKYYQGFTKTIKRQTVNLQNLNVPEYISKLILKIPPTNEQKRIVVKIEELFSLIESNLHEINKVKKQIVNYKKSLLFSSFSGNITNGWRVKNSTFTGKSTIEKSLKQRKELWNEKEKSKKKPKKYTNPVKPLLSNLPKIPSSWSWASFEEISERVTVGHVGSMRNEYVDSGIPFLRSQNVRENKFDEKGLKFISQDFHEKLSKSKLSPNDVVAVRSGDVGVSCVIPETLNDANCSDLLIVKNPLGINPHYGAFYLNSIAESRVRQQQVGIALIHFNTKSLAKLAIPIPHIDEQNLLVISIQKSFSFIENIMTILENLEQKLTIIKQSILKQAFEGNLIPQDPNDEPAEILLQKIKQEKEQLKQQEKKPRRNKNAR